MFEGMEIAESINEDVVELFDEKPTRVYDNHAGISRKKRGEAVSSNNYSQMSESNGKHRKGYVDHLKDILKHTCLIHDPVH